MKPCSDGQGKVIIFSSFKGPLDRLAELKGSSIVYTGEVNKLDRQKAVDEFQETDKYCYFLGTIGAAGVAITLTAANRVAFLDLPWTPGGKSQAEDRAWRIGQKRPVEIVNVLAKGTIDERMLEILADKEFIVSQAVDGKTADAAQNESIAASLLNSFRRSPNLNETIRQYEPDTADLPANAVDADTLEILQGLNEEAPVRLFEKVTFAEKGEYAVDLETGKMELYFDKASYLALPEDLKKAVKSYFLFSRNKGAWISKGQADSYMPQEIVKRLGFEGKGEIGERLSFAKKIEQKAERAEAKAERYEHYSESAGQRSKQLQSDWRKYSQDLAFVTQPGRFPFRDKVIARFEKGIEEGIKAQHYSEIADRLSKSSAQSELKNPTYLDNRIREGEAELRKIDRDAKEYESLGREVPERLHQRADEELEKLLFYKKALEDLGGIQYNQSNVKKGDRVRIRHGWAIVKNTGPKNLTVVIAEGGAKGMELKYSYAEIREHEPFMKSELVQKRTESVPESASKTKQISVKPSQARLFDYSWLAQRIEKCNLSVRDVDAALNWRPLRNIVSTAVGVGARVSLCSIGIVEGMYQVTIDGLTINAEGKIAKAVMKTTNIKRVYTPIAGQRVYEVIKPEEKEAELTFQPQEVSMIPARREAAEQAAMFEANIKGDLSKSMKDEIHAIEVYRERGKRAYAEGDYKTQGLYQHIDQEELSHYEEFAKRAQEIGGKVKLAEGKFSVCSKEEAKKLERCILLVKKKGTAVNPFALCQSALKCKKGAKVSESGDTIKITGKCEDGQPEKCVFTLKRVGNSLKVVGSRQLGKAIESPSLKEEAVPPDVKAAINNPVEVKSP